MDSNALCDGCNKIIFDAAGFYSHDGLHDRSIRARNLPLPPPRLFVEIKGNLEQCVFCTEIAEIFSEWSLQQFGKQVAPDPANVIVEVGNYILQSPENLVKGDFLQRIRVRLSVRYGLPGRLSSTAVQFQKCSQHPLTVSEMCNRKSFDWESADKQAYSGRIRPLVADQRLFCKWKETCRAMHGDSCNLIFTGMRPARLRLIDVEQRCVVDSEDGSNYVALSYVWGRVELPQLIKSTDECFRQAGSLDRKTILPTIDDAIEVTQSLGEKYLWVDCLCIMQDDAADKHRYISQMDSIFGFASLTIVAAAGVDAKAGLPGIKSGSRTREQIPFTIRGVSLLRTLDPEGPAAWSVGDWPSYLSDTVWYSRGWTFQEKIFSGRALIFTAEQVYWECQKATWCEDGVWETSKPPTIFRWSFAEEEFRHPWASDVESFEIAYRMLVEEYSTRSLSYESDSLDAFAGILNAFERQSGYTFLWGLPAAFLSTALTWPCDRFYGTPLRWITNRRPDCAARRSLDCTLRSYDGTTTSCPLPSWSWVGWVGDVRFERMHGSLNSETFDLIFYILDGSSSIVPALACHQTHNEEVQVVLKERDLGTHSVDIPSQAFVWREPEARTIVTREDIPASVLARSIASNILFFWSSSAKLYLENIGRDKRGEDELVISSDKGKVVPSYWSHRPLFIQGHKELVEFVVIGRENLDSADKELEPFIHGLALLLVFWDSDGVAHRQGLVYIKTSDWVELDNRVWKLISLG